MSFLLDTDTCIYAMKGLHRVSERMREHRRSELWVSSISRAELLGGEASSGSPTRNLHVLGHFLLPLTLIDFTAIDADAYGAMRAYLARKGQLFGPLDMLLAAQAVARSLTVVTNNEREFGRVPDLQIENWAR